MLTASELKSLPLGTRVVLPNGADAWPDFNLRGRFAATVTGQEPDCVWVCLDEHRPELDEWDNCVQVWVWAQPDGTEMPVHDVALAAEPRRFLANPIPSNSGVTIMEKSFYHGSAHRFCVRPFVTRWNDVQYMVCDANWVTDADIANGHSSPVVAQFPSAQMAIEWIDGVEAGAYESIPHESNFEGWPELKARAAGR